MDSMADTCSPLIISAMCNKMSNQLLAQFVRKKVPGLVRSWRGKARKGEQIADSYFFPRTLKDWSRAVTWWRGSFANYVAARIIADSRKKTFSYIIVTTGIMFGAPTCIGWKYPNKEAKCHAVFSWRVHVKSISHNHRYYSWTWTTGKCLFIQSNDWATEWGQSGCLSGTGSSFQQTTHNVINSSGLFSNKKS